MTYSKSSSVVSATVFSTCTPALLTTTSTRPNASAAAATRASAWVGSATSVRTHRAPEIAVSRRLPDITWAPAATNRSATARPMPELAPVTTTAASLRESTVCSPGPRPLPPIRSASLGRFRPGSAAGGP